MTKFSYFITVVFLAFSLCGCASFQDEVSMGESNGLYEKYMSYYSSATSRSDDGEPSVFDSIFVPQPVAPSVCGIDISELPLMNLEQLDSVELLIKSRYDIPELSLAEQQEREDYMYMMVQDALGGFGGVSALLDFMQEYTESGGGPDNLVALAPAGLNGVSETIYLGASVYVDCYCIPLRKYAEELKMECLLPLLPEIDTKFLLDAFVKMAVEGVVSPALDALFTAEDIIFVIQAIKKYYDCAHPDRIR